MLPVYGQRYKCELRCYVVWVCFCVFVKLLLLTTQCFSVYSEYAENIIVFPSRVYKTCSILLHVFQALKTVSGHYPSLLLGLFFLSFSITPQGKLGNHRRLEDRRLQWVKFGGEISPQNMETTPFCATQNLKPLNIFHVIKRRVPSIVFISFSINSFLFHKLLFLSFPSVLP